MQLDGILMLKNYRRNILVYDFINCGLHFQSWKKSQKIVYPDTFPIHMLMLFVSSIKKICFSKKKYIPKNPKIK